MAQNTNYLPSDNNATKKINEAFKDDLAAKDAMFLAASQSTLLASALDKLPPEAKIYVHNGTGTFVSPDGNIYIERRTLPTSAASRNQSLKFGEGIGHEAVHVIKGDGQGRPN